RECLRSAKARLSARPCRQRLRPASGRSPGNPARSCPSVHLPFSPVGPLSFLLPVAPTTCGPACGVQCPHTGALQHDPHPQVTLLSLEMSKILGGLGRVRVRSRNTELTEHQPLPDLTSRPSHCLHH